MRFARPTFAFVGAVLLVGAASPASADPVMLPSSAELSQYLVIAFASEADGNAFDCSNCELGADQEVLSRGSNAERLRSENMDGDPNNQDVFIQDVMTDRWTEVNDNATLAEVGVADYLEGASGVFEGIDNSGNIALTGGSTAQYHFSGVDLYADIGIDCLNPGCDPGGDSNTAWGQSSDTFTAGSGGGGGEGFSSSASDAINGVGGFSVLLAELNDGDATIGDDWQSFINSLTTDVVWTTDIVNENSVDGMGPFVTDLDVIDLNNDGVAVIDIDQTGDEFEVNNSDWILQTTEDTLVIFRLIDGTQGYDFSQSSIVMSRGGTDPQLVDWTTIGAIFYTDMYNDENVVFEGNDIILNGIALWDFWALMNANPAYIDAPTQIHINNGQRCAQFISYQINFQNVRWNRCDFGPGTSVPEPASLALFATGAAAFAIVRRRRRTFKDVER